MDTVSNAMGKRSGMSPVDDYIRELLASSPQGRIDESFQTLNEDPRAVQGGSLAAGLLHPWGTQSDTPGYGEEAFLGPRGGEMPVYVEPPGGRRSEDMDAVIAEAMKQPPLGTEEMNPRPDGQQYQGGDYAEEEVDYGPDSENANEYVAQNFPRRDERLATPGWIPAEEPGTAEDEISRYADKRSANTSRTAGSVPGATAPFRLRGPVNLQMDEQSLIQQLLSRFR